ncbi:MAG: hypothetical protein PHQ03_12225 [Methylococcales bacterium]|nr:hypothetical protein [Methylococcales bacterium]
MSKVTNKGFYDGYVASAYWSTNKLPKPTHYRGYVTLKDDDIDELKHFGSVLITCFSANELGDVYPCYQQDFTPIGFNLSKDKPIEKHDYGNTLSLVFEEDNAPPVQHDNAPKEKPSKYQQRYDDFKAWLESDKPSIHKMTQDQIIASLQKREKDKKSREKLWSHGHKEFWEKQDLIHFKHGRPSTTNR